MVDLKILRQERGEGMQRINLNSATGNPTEKHRQVAVLFQQKKASRSGDYPPIWPDVAMFSARIAIESKKRSQANSMVVSVKGWSSLLELVGDSLQLGVEAGSVLATAGI
jgi:hypothetical protein